MDLGLEALSDDQLLELCQQMCGELCRRDPVVTRTAQQVIYTEAEKVKVWRENIEKAVAKVRSDFVKMVRKECLEEVERLVATGELKLFASQAECEIIIRESKASKEFVAERILDEARRLSPGLPVPPPGELKDMARRLCQEWLVRAGIPDPEMAVIAALVKAAREEVERKLWTFSPKRGMTGDEYKDFMDSRAGQAFLKNKDWLL